MYQSNKPIYEVIVVATMSAGKSTVINALIGQELLHSANEATTATITRIHDQDHLPFFSGNAYSYENELIESNPQISAELMREWNRNEKIKTIDLAGDMRAFHNDDLDIVIYDTPGPNNSQDSNHEALTLEVINDGNYGTILYVINATQLGVQDDRELLEKILSALSNKAEKKEIIFVLNKADELDPEKGEYVDQVVKRVKAYLVDVGFKKPIIIPTAANQALACQKVLNNDKLTRTVKFDLKRALVAKNEFIMAATLPKKVKAPMNNQQIFSIRDDENVDISSISPQVLHSAFLRSGFGLVTLLLQEKLKKKLNKNLRQLKKEHSKKVVKKEAEKVKCVGRKIYIEHNPFTIETKFEINGDKPENISFLETYSKQRLQLWIEKIFPEFYHLFNGDLYLDVTFKGVETDYIDIVDAVKNAEKLGFIINLSFIEAEDSTIRLEKMQKLMQEAQAHPIFREKLQDKRSQIHKDFQAALNKDFDVYVAATMSAGKSTLINAMLGTDLLPAANEATTATIAQITDNDSMEVGHFEAVRIDKNGEVVDHSPRVDLELLKAWNSDSSTKLIALEGNIMGVKERDNVRLVLTDTPGPNNSQDPEHSRATMAHIGDSTRNPLILYILNATQLGTNDDQCVLEQIAKIMSKGGKQAKDRFIFVVNKMDAFDPEAGECVEDALNRVREYLENNGIENPLIYPVSANFTRLLRKRQVNEGALTRKERGDLTAMEDLFSEEPSMDFIQYMPLTQSVRKNLADKKISDLLKRSGLPAIESMIDEYINKYNLPNRVNRAYLALEKAIKESSGESQLISDLSKYMGDLDSIEYQLSQLTQNKKVSVKAKTNMERVIDDNKSLYSLEVIKKVDDFEAEIRVKIYDFQEQFFNNSEAGKVLKSTAEQRIKTLVSSVTFESNRLINSYDAVILESQKITEEKLMGIFNQYVKDLFENIDIPLPILEGLKGKISSIGTETNLGLDDDEVDVKEYIEKVKIGQESYQEFVGTRSKAKWYNPFSWFSSEDVYETRYKDIYKDEHRREEWVDLEEVWADRESQLLSYFNNLSGEARNKVSDDVKAYANSFKEFIDGEFQIKFNEIIDELNQQIENKEELQHKIDEANKKLESINGFNTKLNQVLEL